ncbi:hypothetical protein M378DRAFT_167094 [Amanita muscaria Koide BX008]|uniref:Uncharacterized protein n=1 Tax=Amanita muscaria (strain Koide BX008) TaxID=946122 RepID=A0A0C2WIE4_AMAMK|nr:hypothetical protein M378DRAFT_167094 [Amanita muscaria Koide BX008]
MGGSDIPIWASILHGRIYEDDSESHSPLTLPLPRDQSKGHTSKRRYCEVGLNSVYIEFSPPARCRAIVSIPIQTMHIRTNADRYNSYVRMPRT